LEASERNVINILASLKVDCDPTCSAAATTAARKYYRI
jgi:hypothetical protein